MKNLNWKNMPDNNKHNEEPNKKIYERKTHYYSKKHWIDVKKTNLYRKYKNKKPKTNNIENSLSVITFFEKQR